MSLERKRQAKAQDKRTPAAAKAQDKRTPAAVKAQDKRPPAAVKELQMQARAVKLVPERQPGQDNS